MKKANDDKRVAVWLKVSISSRVSLICRSPLRGGLLIISYLLFTICIDNCSVTRLVISLSVMTRLSTFRFLSLSRFQLGV